MTVRAWLLFVLLLPALLVPTGARAWLCGCAGTVGAVDACAEAVEVCCDERDADDSSGPSVQAPDCGCCEQLEIPRSNSPGTKAPDSLKVPDLVPVQGAVAFDLTCARSRANLSLAAPQAPRASPPGAALPLRI
ncbi:MAG: hypothetical protein FJ299_01010 [Planctomycetes bacterium]|nr:hypothetical protein [Planctomycetota bacterium]